MTDGKACD